MFEAVIDLVAFLQEAETQRVLLALAQLVGAVVSARWAWRGAYWLAGLALVAVSVALVRPAGWAWRRVWPSPSEDERARRELVAEVRQYLRGEATYDPGTGILIAGPVGVQFVSDSLGRMRPDAVEMAGLAITDDHVGRWSMAAILADVVDCRARLVADLAHRKAAERRAEAAAQTRARLEAARKARAADVATV